MPFVSQGYLDSLSELGRTEFEANNTPLGYHPKTGDRFYVSQIDRDAATYVVGIQGTGKSRFLEGMIHHDIDVGRIVVDRIHAGRSVIVFDPHYDLTRHCLAALPAHRVRQTYAIDPLDADYPLGINLFDIGKRASELSEVDRTEIVDRLMHVFEALFPEALSQQHLPSLLRAAVHVFLDNPGSTLVDLLRFLRDEGFRARLLQHTTDASVREYWELEYNRHSDVERTRRVQPLVNRLNALFMGRPLIRNVLGQRKNSIDWRRAIERRECIFITLPLNKLKQDAQLIGTILIAQISAAIFSFADTPEEQRPGVNLYIDEFQTMSTPDVSKLFSEARKYRMAATVGHQWRDQLPGFLQDTTTSARTKVVFQIKADDAGEMGAYFPVPEATIKPDDIEPHATQDLLVKAASFPDVVREFVEIYLLPLQRYRRGHVVEIRNRGADLYGGMLDVVAMFQSTPTTAPIAVDDPLPFLDGLLYEVMRNGNPHIAIPGEIARGFANGGQGFFAQARHVWRNPALLPSFTFPQHLVVPAPTGLQWTRPPETAREQFLHFIFHLRQTMRYLAEHPIGKATVPHTSAIGQMLTRLPRRSAFVRSGEDVGVIYTLPTPEGLQGSALHERLQIIRDQTRATYCRSQAEVEADIVGRGGQTPQDNNAPPMRWEEIRLDDHDDEPGTNH